MDGRADSFEAILQTAKELTAALKKQRRTVRGNGCIKHAESAKQVKEIDEQLKVLKELHSKRDDFLQFYAVAVMNNRAAQNQMNERAEFCSLMQRIVTYGGDRSAHRLKLYNLAVAYN